MEKRNYEIKPAGYLFLQKKLNLNVMPNWHLSFVSTAGTIQSRIQNGFIEETYPQSYWPGENIGDHLEFALKYDGINFGFLAAVFNTVEESEITNFVLSKPTGIYSRRIWFFFEFLTGKKLAVEDMKQGNYIEAVESERYYAINNGNRVKRQRIIDNLLGDREFCPIVRRTEKLKKMEVADLQKRCREIITAIPPELLKRALTYLYNKETKSSFEIEHLKPDALKTEKFIGLLELAENQDFFEKRSLIDLQNRIVDPRFMNSDYRLTQNYVGQTVSHQKEIVHYISPKPEDLPEIIDGMINSHLKMKNSSISPIVHAAVVSYGFVFAHPFEDGNGRIHRFLIHNILSVQGMVPIGLMFPVSAVMLKNPEAYNSSLEAFSRPLIRLIEYSLDDIGQLTVHNNTGSFYRYIDLTAQAEALYSFVDSTIEKELVDELQFLAGFDAAKKEIMEIIEMPDRLVDLFIHLCIQNNGHLSTGKRSTHFIFLTDEELSLMEKAVGKSSKLF